MKLTSVETAEHSTPPLIADTLHKRPIFHRHLAPTGGFPPTSENRRARLLEQRDTESKGIRLAESGLFHHPVSVVRRGSDDITRIRDCP
ncbi:hypothetical protein AVEN_213930-1 [Araneus ventricosus]|uniref:Uncharacterized protein n=1 Tax=Araneus ventricosus TaxID=182803 RepID=A0A4Y2SAG5_ARAVE|nr:hypothetical protein AVEN_213930-1 [Araneus ventricosus]